jgi:hypothetical protein
VVLVDLDEGGLEAATQALSAIGHRAIGVTDDISDKAQTGCDQPRPRNP